MGLYQIYIEYKELNSYYLQYLQRSNLVIYNFSQYVDLDYTKQKQLQPLKVDDEIFKTYRVSFNNQVYVIKKQFQFEECMSYLDPNLVLFHNEEKEYKKYLVQEQLKQNLRNKFLYQLLNQKMCFEERLGDLKLQKTIFTSLTFEKYVKSLTKQAYMYNTKFEPILAKELKKDNDTH